MNPVMAASRSKAEAPLPVQPEWLLLRAVVKMPSGYCRWQGHLGAEGRVGRFARVWSQGNLLSWRA